MHRTIIAWTVFGLTFWGCSNRNDPPPHHADIERAEIARAANSTILAEATRDPAPDRRARAALAIGRIQAAEDTALLIPLLQDSDRDVRMAAAFAIGQQGLNSAARPDAKAIAALESALADAAADAALRARIVEAIGKQASAESESMLAAVLTEDEALEVRTQAAHALMRRRFVPLLRGEVEEAADWNAAASDALIAALRDEADEVREAAAHALSRYPWATAVPALSGVLGDTRETVRVFAVRSIGRSGTAADGESVVPALQDSSAKVRYQAVTALARLERPDLLPGALRDDASPFVRAAYLTAVADDDSPAVRELVRSFQKDASATVRSAALAAHAAGGDSEALEAIQAHAEATGSLDRMAAANAADTWREAVGEKGEDTSEAKTLLLQLAADSDANVIATALRGLRPWLDREDVLKTLDTVLADQRLAVRGTAASLLDELDADERASRIEKCWQISAGVEWVEVRETLVDALASLLEEDAHKEAALYRLKTIQQNDPQSSVRDRARAAAGEEDSSESVHTPPAFVERWNPDTLERFSNPPVVRMETTRGSFRIETYPYAAPIHTANFIGLVRDGFYDGLLWHRVVPNFVVQGGDPTGTGWGGPGYALPDEIHPASYLQGALGMPKAGKDTGGGQLFFSLLPTPHLDGNYTVFGRIIEGLDVIDEIEVGDRILSAKVEK
jgi:cyclophilin family peptidyl-prolyl cis-trans isomerase/HEAT repeat protein